MDVICVTTVIVHLTTQMQYIGRSEGERQMNNCNERQKDTEAG